MIWTLDTGENFTVYKRDWNENCNVLYVPLEKWEEFNNLEIDPDELEALRYGDPLIFEADVTYLAIPEDLLATRYCFKNTFRYFINIRRLTIVLGRQPKFQTIEEADGRLPSRWPVEYADIGHYECWYYDQRYTFVPGKQQCHPQLKQPLNDLVGYLEGFRRFVVADNEEQPIILEVRPILAVEN